MGFKLDSRLRNERRFDSELSIRFLVSRCKSLERQIALKLKDGL